MLAELMKSDLVRPPSVEIYPSSGRAALVSVPNARFQILVVASPGPYARTFFLLFFWRFFVIFDNIGPRESQNFNTLLLPQISAQRFQNFPEFSSQLYSQNYRNDL